MKIVLCIAVLMLCGFYLSQYAFDRPQLRGMGQEGGPVSVEAFDTAGRLLQRTAAVRTGAGWAVHLDERACGLVVLRASQAQRIITGKVFVR